MSWLILATLHFIYRLRSLINNYLIVNSSLELNYICYTFMYIISLQICFIISNNKPQQFKIKEISPLLNLGP